MDRQRKLDQFLLWMTCIVSLINAIILILITRAQNNSLLKLSANSILLFVLLLLPGSTTLVLQNNWIRSIFAKQLPLFRKSVSFLAFWTIILSAFFLLMPWANYRLGVSDEIWLRLLPAVLTYALLSALWFLHIYLQIRNQTVASSKDTRREVFIDFARGFAIVIAVISHAFYAFGYDVLFGKSMYQIMSITRLATPSFILITGMMFELVYLPKVETRGFKATAASLIRRSLQCYLAYLITVFIEWFNQHLSTINARYAVTFLGNSLFSDILKFYALFLLLAIPIIWIRKRFGIWWISMLPVVVWVVDVLLDGIHWPHAQQPIANLSALIFGHPGISNFSIWHALTFMSFGMLTGYMLKQSQKCGSWKRFQLTILLLTVLCLIISLIAISPTSWENLLKNFSTTYRSNHEIPYYSIGSFGAFLLLWISWKLRRWLKHPWLESTFTSLGRDSLWAFAAGNSLVALLPALRFQAWFVVLFILAVFGGSLGLIKMKNLLHS